jgi:hypothetical protein
MRNSVRAELCLEGREMLHQECRQEAIFTKGEQILLMQGVNVGLSVLFNNSARDDDGTTLVSCSDAIESEAPGQTSDRAKQTFESFRKVVRDIIFVHLDHCPPRVVLVGEFGFSAYTDDLRIVGA